jgi:hypothetical protein
MDRHRTLVRLSAIPVALIGVTALSVASSSAASGFGDPIPSAIVSLAILAVAIGVTRGNRWAFVVEAIIGAILVAGVTFAALFSLTMARAETGGLDSPMLGTPFGIANGWTSLVLYLIAFMASAWMIVAARLGIRSTRS